MGRALGPFVTRSPGSAYVVSTTTRPRAWRWLDRAGGRASASGAMTHLGREGRRRASEGSEPPSPADLGAEDHPAPITWGDWNLAFGQKAVRMPLTFGGFAGPIWALVESSEPVGVPSGS